VPDEIRDLDQPLLEEARLNVGHGC
jgi:hypothetical protein